MSRKLPVYGSMYGRMEYMASAPRRAEAPVSGGCHTLLFARLGQPSGPPEHPRVEQRALAVAPGNRADGVAREPLLHMQRVPAVPAALAPDHPPAQA